MHWFGTREACPQRIVGARSGRLHLPPHEPPGTLQCRSLDNLGKVRPQHLGGNSYWIRFPYMLQNAVNMPSFFFPFFFNNLSSNWFPYNTQRSSQQMPSSVPITHFPLPPTPPHHQPSVCSQYFFLFIILVLTFGVCHSFL